MRINKNIQNILIIAIITALLVIIASYVFRRFSSSLYWPVPGKVTSPFGNRINPVTKEPQFHSGVDIGVPLNTPVKSPGPGIVSKIWKDDLNGNALRIAHTNGFSSGFAHLNSIQVQEGQRVKAHQPVALSGNTGRSTGPHLHYTLRDKTGALVDPKQYLI